jgi:hypothetical protein
MKRKDLTVGAELWHSRHRDWDRSVWAGDKAVVVDTQPYRRPRQFEVRRYDPQWVADPKGTLVLVDIHRGRGDRAWVEREIVPLAHLHGPYEENRRQIAVRAEQDKQRRQEGDAARRMAEQSRNAAVARAKAMGVDVSPLYDSAWWDYVKMPVAELDRLLDALALKNPMMPDHDSYSADRNTGGSTGAEQ